MTTLKTTLLGLAAAGIVLGALAACSPLGALNALSPGKSLRTSAGVPYGASPRHKLDIYTPEQSVANAPVIVFFMGGNWVKGERGDYAFVGRALAARGYVVVIPDYRLYPEVTYPDFLDDSAGAVAWTAREISRFGGDPSRLYVMGHSAGAYNAAMVALDPRYLAKFGMRASALRGLIGLAGPYDFLPIHNPTTKPVFDFPNTPPASQPIHHVSKAAPPALLIAANDDDLVNARRNTGALANKLRAKGVTVQEVYFDGVSHTTLVASLAAPLRSLAPTLDVIDTFVGSDAGRNPGSGTAAAAR
ncbi:alpha/beta hydrolase [Massilia sp. PAMC28688]|uniref:alpha/beta hydrolase n=1 Tax=Massilia sp. PAMC28688 TaxID=2861283 RepID=UPI001C63208B|nr:alpha/beta hydrolase [Massilia sp. PAMC28688]QYF92242.1 alpha/beta hydrolase [Massilia sp. PAMC28688]